MVKFGFDAPTVGVFFSAVGLVTAVVQGCLLPALIPKHITTRAAIPLGLLLHAAEYICYGLADQGWQLLTILVVFCLAGMEPPATHALISSQVSSV